MRRLALVGALAMALILTTAATAFAGEWNQGRWNGTGGDLPAKYHANSECLFNGRDEPDESYLGAGDGEPWVVLPDGSTFHDDPLWGQTPARGRVQSGGQMIAAGAGEPGAPGTACNGHLNPLK